MARNVLIGRRNWAATADFSGGIWEAALPLANLQDMQPQVVAQAVSNVDWNSPKFDVDLGYIRRVGVFSFANLRATPMGLCSLKAGADPTFTTNAYEVLGTIWPGDGSPPFDYNPWHEFALTHTYMRDEYEALGMPRFLVPPSVINCRYIRVEFKDSTNSEPFRIGHFGAWEVWEAPMNIIYGWSIAAVDESDIANVPFGSTFITKRGIRRRMNFGFDAIEDAEFLSRQFGLGLIKGRSDPLVVVPFPDDTAQLERRSIYGVLSSDPAFTNPYFGRYASTFQIDQLR